LRNVIASAVALSASHVIEAEHLFLGKISSDPSPAPQLADGAGKADPERARIVDALDRCGWNQSKAAAELGISRPTLTTRLDDYKMPRPRKHQKGSPRALPHGGGRGRI